MRRIFMRKSIKKGITSLLMIGCIGWLYWGNESIQTTAYTVKDPAITEALTGFTVVQVSDLHNKSFGKAQDKLMAKIQEAKPDLIAVTGDVVDSRRTNLSVALVFLEKAVNIAPVYYVPGNHEARIEEYEAFKTAMIDLGVEVLDNRAENMQVNDDVITIAGVEDPAFNVNGNHTEEAVIESAITNLALDREHFTLLLSHRPEMLDLYAKEKINLVLTGHAHGGQIRIPFVGGMIAPNQGILPTYTAGQFIENDTTMIVSRGLGNSLFPLRVNNRPELVIATLQQEINNEK